MTNLRLQPHLPGAIELKDSHYMYLWAHERLSIVAVCGRYWKTSLVGVGINALWPRDAI